MNLVIQQPRWFIESRGETTGQERSDGMGNGMGGECVRSGRERAQSSSWHVKIIISIQETTVSFNPISLDSRALPSLPPPFIRFEII